MDVLTLDLLSYLLSNLEDESIGQLSITSKNMGNITKVLKNDAIFYKSRVKNLLGYSVQSTQRSFSFAYIDSYKGDWKGFYYILIKSDPDNTNWLNSALSSAVSKGNYLASKVLLVDPRVDPSDDDNDAINFASEIGHLEIVKLLLTDQRVDPSDLNNEAIRLASFSGHIEVVKFLLADQRVDPSDNDNWAIQRASKNGHLDVVKLLLADQRVDPSARNNYAILFASKNCHQEVLRLLLGSDKINVIVKTQALKELELKCSSSKLIYDNIEKLAMKSLKELVQIGNQSLQARDIIMSKYFWWVRLEILHNMTNIKEDPFKLSLQLEQ